MPYSYDYFSLSVDSGETIQWFRFMLATLAENKTGEKIIH